MSNQVGPPQGTTDASWFGHPRQLARLFTTEMWERFGYYGMRALLTLYLTTWFAFHDKVAAGLYGAFTSLVYLTPLIGGLLADRYLGYKRSVKFGAIMMAVGYFALCFSGEQSRPYLEYGGQKYDVSIKEIDKPIADENGKPDTKKSNEKFVTIEGKERRIVSLDSGALVLLGGTSNPADDLLLESGSFRFDGSRDPFWVTLMFLSLSCVIIGNGFFKPNISTIVGSLYPKGDTRRDGGFTIFYMGINLGSIFSQFLCPLFQKWWGFWAGFLLAAVGMLCAWALFQFEGGRLKGYGEPPPNASPKKTLAIFICAILSIPIVWFLINNTMVQSQKAVLKQNEDKFGLAYLEPISENSFKVLASGTAPSMPIKIAHEGDEYLIQELKPIAGNTFEAVLEQGKQLAVKPVPVVHGLSRVDEQKAKYVILEIPNEQTIRVQLPEKQKSDDKDILLRTPAVFELKGKIVQAEQIKELGNRELEIVLNPSTVAREYSPPHLEVIAPPDIPDYLMKLPLLGKILFALSIVAVVGIPIWSFFAGTREEAEKMVVAIVLVVFSVVFWTLFEQAGSSLTLFADRNTDLHVVGSYNMPAAQTQIFNPLFIVIFAPLFSMMWLGLAKKGFEPSIPTKFAIGLVLVGLGFLVLVYGAKFANKDFQVGLVWLALAYLLHSLGELCISPVGLSMITKLSIARIVGLMMGVWFLSSAMAQYVGGVIAQFASVETVGGQVTNLSKSLATYVGVFQQIGIWSIGFGVVLFLLGPFLKRMMHGVR